MIALVIWADKEIQDGVSPIRDLYDAPFTSMAPHITVMFPTKPAASLEEISELLANHLRSTPAFQLTITHWKGFLELAREYSLATNIIVSRFPTLVNMVGLMVEQGKEDIITIRSELGSHPLFEQVNELLAYPPFMAVAHGLPWSEYQHAMEYLSTYSPNYSIEVSSMDLIQNLSGEWHTIRSFQLGRN